MRQKVQLAVAVALTCVASLAILAFGWYGGTGGLSALSHLPGAEDGKHPAAPVRAKGYLVGVDLARGTVTLALEGSTLTVRTDAGTAVFVRGRFGSLSDLPLGGSVCAAVADGVWPTAEWLEPC